MPSACVKEPINEVGKNAISLVLTNSHCGGAVFVHVEQKSPWLYPYFYLCPIALWTSLQPENTSTTEMNMDWKFLQIYTPYIFMELKEPLNWLKRKNKRDRRKLKRNCKTLSKVKCIQIYCKKCLILDVSAIERCPLHGGFVMRVWPSFYPFLRKVSVVERCPQ